MLAPLPTEVRDIIFSYVVKHATLMVRTSRYYRSMYRDLVLCEKLNQMVNRECEHNPGANFKAKILQTKTSLHLYNFHDPKYANLCILSWDILDIPSGDDHVNSSFGQWYYNPVETIIPMHKSDMHVLYSSGSSRCDGTLIKVFPRERSTGVVLFDFKRLQRGQLGINFRTVFDATLTKRNVAGQSFIVMLDKGRYVVTNCIIDHLTGEITSVIDVQSGSYDNPLTSNNDSMCSVQ